MDNDNSEDWWSTGFPKDPPTKLQMFFLSKRQHRLLEELPGKEAMVLKLGGFERWIGAITKSHASTIISMLKKNERDRKVTQKLTTTDVGLKENICSICGSSLSEGNNGVSRICKKCDKGSLYVQL